MNRPHLDPQQLLRALYKKPLRALYKKPLRALYKKPLRALSNKPLRALLIAATGFAVISPAAAAPVFFEAAGPDAASIQATVDDFRDTLGPLNAPNPGSVGDGSLGSGRRQINWDAAPDGISDPNAFPGDFFNGPAAPRARGALFANDLDGNANFLISSTAASGQPVEFGFDSEFSTFSPERLFAPVGTTTTLLGFAVPGLAQQATVSGVGVVFSGVEIAGLTTLALFDINLNLLAERSVLPSDAIGGVQGSLSFLGTAFDAGERVALAAINTGDAALQSNGVFGPGTDRVVMDDFIFGEPVGVPVAVPEPMAIVLIAGGLALIGLRQRRPG